MTHLTPTTINLENIACKSVNKMGANGKFIKLHYTGDGGPSIKIELPHVNVLKKPYSFDGDKNKMYFVLSLKKTSDDKEKEDIIDFFNKFDNWMMTFIADYSYDWFGTKLHFSDVKNIYKKSLFQKDNEINLRLKIPFHYGKCTCAISKEDGEPMSAEAVEENMEYSYIIELNGVWYTPNNIGVTWNCSRINLF
tara:strand:- start:4553 stop:5134 length:582 start_codon:yes stop_codon:yes gene_type:complete